jgi:uncharacterized membrane protein
MNSETTATTTLARARGEIHLTGTIDLACPAAEVWAIVADYGRDPEWRRGVATMAPSPAGEVRPGTTTTEVLRFAGRTWHNGGEVVSVEPDVRFTWRTVQGADAAGARAVLVLPGGGCRVHLELRVRPHGVERVLAPLLARLLERGLARDLNRLRRLATDEREVGPRVRDTVL